jgi:hypothetical protein
MSTASDDRFLVMGCKGGQCMRLEHAGAARTQQAVRRLRRLGWAVTVVTLDPPPTPPPP